MNMMTMWDPFKELDNFSNRLSNIFGRSMTPARHDGESDLFTKAQWAPTVDITEDKDHYYIKAELPGIEKDQVKVHVENGYLTIQGERKFEEEKKDTHVHRIERSYGSFVRAFALPDDADSNKIDAQFKNGLLSIQMPKSAKPQGKQIEVKVS
jgi:HSP20 family protein